MAGKAKRQSGKSSAAAPRIRMVPLDRIRPEEGLGRKRERAGHEELARSISRFGVLTPITVRPAEDGSGDYLLVKGQGRTLACKHLGLAKIPALVVEGSFSETQKVQQFLVENVARLKMKPVDRALLIAHARASGEETRALAERFGVSATTVRKLESQLGGASDAEIAALRRGDVTLAMQAVIARLVPSDERDAVINVVAGSRLTSVDLQSLLLALGWQKLVNLGEDHRKSRLALLAWACKRLAEIPRGSFRSRVAQMAADLPDVVSEPTPLQKEGVG